MKKSLLLLVAFVIISTALQAQNGTRSIDYNARAFGRGGVSIGFFDDNVGLMMSNPAGISFMHDKTFDINAIIMLPSPSFTNYKKNADGTPTSTVLNDNVSGYKDPFVLPSAGYVHKFKDSKFTLGLGFFTVGGMGAEFDLNHELFKDASGNYLQQKYRSRYAVMQGGLTGAYKITDNFSIGISAHLVYSTIGFNNPYSLSPTVMNGLMPGMGGLKFGQYFAAPRPTQASDSTRFTGLGYSEVTSIADMNNLKSFNFNGRVGLAYKFSDKFTAGLNFSTPVSLSYTNGIANLDMSAQFQDAFKRAVGNYLITHPSATPAYAQAYVQAQFTALGIDMTKGYAAQYNITNDFEVPMSVGFGCMYAPEKNFRLGFDIEWINWSSSAKSMKLTMTGGQNPNINLLLGQGGANQSALVVDFPLNWKDAILVKFGGEYDVNKNFTLRAGYSYGNNPIPTSTVVPIIPAVLEHHISAGTTFNLTERAQINLAIEYGLKTTENSDNSNSVATEYNGSSTSLQNLLGHISVTYFLR